MKVEKKREKETEEKVEEGRERKTVFSLRDPHILK